MTNPYAPPRAVVEDIAQASGQFEPAERITRLGASILDALIFGFMVYLPFVMAAVAIPMAAGMSATTYTPDPDAFNTAMGVGGLIALVGFTIWCSLTITYMNRNGQSIAKKLIGIKVVRTDGSRASLGRLIWLRNVLNWFISIVPLYGLLDSLFIFGETRQCLHDKIADTIVIKA